MAIMSITTLRPDPTIAANIRAWADWIESVLTTIGGWTVTADTGQTLPSALPAATALNQKCGYRVYKMNDSFTAVVPIYMRIDYGSSNGTLGGFTGAGLWPVIGKGTDGAGNITDILYALTTVPIPVPTVPPISNNLFGGSPGNLPFPSYASADHSRFAFGMWNENSGLYNLTWSLERSRNAAGDYTGDLLLTYGQSQGFGGGGVRTSLNASKYIICDPAVLFQPSTSSGLHYVAQNWTPPDSYQNVTGIGIVQHMKGTAQQPGLSWLTCGGNDVAYEQQITVPIYGQPHNYLCLRGPCTVRVPQVGDFGSRILMLYE